MRALRHSRLTLAFAAVTVLLLMATVAGMIALWPADEPRVAPQQGTGQTEPAEVVEIKAVPCQAPQADDCRRVSVRITGGRDRGRVIAFPVGETSADPTFDVGDKVRMLKNPPPPAGVSPDVAPPYSFADFERRSPMLILALAFALLVVVFGRLRGLLALLGLGLSLLVVVEFVLPALLDGKPPAAVAVVGSFAVMFATLTLAHGVGPKTIAAALGTAGALGLTIGLAVVFTELTHLTGFASEESTLLQAGQRELSLQGLVLAGMIIAALGVLDDVTVSQASTVMALRRANPAHAFGALYRSGLGVGRDHVTATVNTLVLAYIGASLPLALIFAVGETPFADAINREAVAQQVVATLVGSMGLIAAVPITTALAALLAVRLPPGELDESAGHVH